MTATTETPRRYRVRDRGGNVIGTAELRLVPVTVIRIDSSYQRDLDTGWVNRHLPFDPNKAGTVVLSDRAGGPYVVDGQGRLAIAKESGVEAIAAFVITGLAKAQEADLFVALQQGRRNLKSWDLFKGELVAGRPEALEIVRITAGFGFRVDRTGGDTHIAAVEALKRVYRLGGESLLQRVLEVLRSRWFGEARFTSGQIITGLALFFHSSINHPQFDSKRFSDLIEANAPARILREAQAVAERRNATSASSSNVAEAIFDLYNKNLRSEKRLPKLSIGGKKRARPRADVDG